MDDMVLSVSTIWDEVIETVSWMLWCVVGDGKRYGASIMQRAYRFVKRAFDIVISLPVCLLMIVPLGICCIAVCAESKGVPIFSQERVGRYGKKLGMFKLRSMYVDAEERLECYLTSDQLDEWHREHKIANDPRVTKVGKFLRESSLDEFPQFLNVLLGHMSIIGPRPVTKEELLWFGDDVEEFLSAKPGITGYWQAYARNDATFESGERQGMELFYVRNQDLAFDCRIFFKTFSAVFKKTGQ